MVFGHNSTQCNEATTDQCICGTRLLYILVSAIVDVSLLFLLKPFYFIKLLQYFSPGLVKLLLKGNLLRVAVDTGYLVIGSVAKWVIRVYNLDEDMFQHLMWHG